MASLKMTQHFRAKLDYQPTMDDSYGRVVVKCEVGGRSQRILTRVHFKPVLLESNRDLSRCDNFSESETVLTFRSNPPPTQIYFKVKDPQNNFVEFSDHRGLEASVNEASNEVMVMFDNDALSPGTKLHVENAIGSYTVQLTCDVDEDVVAFVILSIICFVAASVVVAILFGVWFIVTRKLWCFDDTSDSNKVKICVEEATRSRRDLLSGFSGSPSSFENTTIATTLSHTSPFPCLSECDYLKAGSY